MKLKTPLAIQALIAAFTKKVLGSNVYAVIAKTDSGLFAVDPEDYGVGRRLRVIGNYGLDDIGRLRPHITPDSRVLIVGAHIGTLAIPISKLCKYVVAIEANPRTYELLKINIAINTAERCQPYNIAASDSNRSIPFLMNRANSGGSKRVPKIKKAMYYYDNPKEISVKGARLDEYLEETDYHIVVMDIEGSEYTALRGMQKILSKSKMLVVEFLPHHIKNVSGVTVEQFLSVIEPHYTRMTIPSKALTVGASEFVYQLNEMYDLGQGDDGIMFEKD